MHEKRILDSTETASTATAPVSIANSLHYITESNYINPINIDIFSSTLYYKEFLF